MKSKEIWTIVAVALVVAALIISLSGLIKGSNENVSLSPDSALNLGHDCYLYKSRSTGTVKYNFNGDKYLMDFIVTDVNTAKMDVNGIRKTVTKGNIYDLTNFGAPVGAVGVGININDITYQSYAGGTKSVSFCFVTIPNDVVTYQGVLDMLNKCQPSWDAIELAADGTTLADGNVITGVTSCNDVCGNNTLLGTEKPKVCINALGIFAKNSTTVIPSLSYNYACNLAFTDIARSVGDPNLNIGEPNLKVWVQCTCC